MFFKPQLLGVLLVSLLMGCATTGAPTQADILASLNRRLDTSTQEMEACFRRELGAGADRVDGRIIVKFEIDSDGLTQNLTVVESQLQDPQAELCVADTIRRIFFEEQLGRSPVRLTKPFSFLAGR